MFVSSRLSLSGFLAMDRSNLSARFKSGLLQQSLFINRVFRDSLSLLESSGLVRSPGIRFADIHNSHLMLPFVEARRVCSGMMPSGRMSWGLACWSRSLLQRDAFTWELFFHGASGAVCKTDRKSFASKLCDIGVSSTRKQTGQLLAWRIPC